MLHFSVIDAVGHAVASALAAPLGVGSLRNSRRREAGLVEQAVTANAALTENAVVPGGYRTPLVPAGVRQAAACAEARLRATASARVPPNQAEGRGKKVSVGVIPIIGVAPIYLGKQKGYFASHVMQRAGQS